MKKKSVIFTIVLLTIGLAVLPQVQAQTAQQQQELEQIARRSMNGLSAQDRRRVVQIMTDMFVAQGMTRQQAAALAEANADTLFMTDIVEMSPEERRQFEEQEERLQHFDQRGSPQSIANAQRAVGRNPGWPTANAFNRYGFTIGQPNDLGDPVFSWVEGTEDGGPKLTIWIEAKGGYSLNTEEMFLNETALQRLERLVASVAGTLDRNRSNDSYRYYERPDPQRQNTATRRYWISTLVQPGRSGGRLAGITITLTTERAEMGAGGR